MMTFTIDSNIINAKQKDPSINKLEELYRLGEIKIVGTERLFQEITEYKNLKAISKVNNYENISEPFVVGYSKIGSFYISDDNPKLPTFTQISEIIFPGIATNNLNENQANDVMHLVAHSQSNSDYFVTNNTRDFIDGKKTSKNKTQDLKNMNRRKLEQIGIMVITPEEAIKLVESK